MIFAIVESVNKRCSCSFTNNSVLYSTFQCFSSNSDSATFRAGLEGLVSVNSSVLAGYVAAWVASDDDVTLQGAQYNFDRYCVNEVVIEDLKEPECAATTEKESSSWSFTGWEILVGIAAVVVVGAVITFAIIFIKCKKRQETGTYRYLCSIYVLNRN